MSETLFSIFPESNGEPRKDRNINASRKKALGDVGNTLPVTHVPRKKNANPKTKETIQCNTTGSYQTSVNIAGCGNSSDVIDINTCGSCSSQLQDNYEDIRPPSDCLDIKDIAYLAREMWSHRVPNSEIYPPSPPFNHFNLDFHLTTLSDDDIFPEFPCEFPYLD